MKNLEILHPGASRYSWLKQTGLPIHYSLFPKMSTVTVFDLTLTYPNVKQKQAITLLFMSKG